jgi:hypothetical protein
MGEGRRMIYDVNELGRIGRVLHEALGLLENEQKRLEQQHGGPLPHGERTAGSPMQTLYGVGLLAEDVRRQLKWVALAAGYISLGMDKLASHVVEVARLKPVSVPSGTDRMARPLGGATVQALVSIPVT